MKQRLFLAIIVLFVAVLINAILILHMGALEQFPTPEQEEKVRIAALCVIIICLAAEVFLVKMWKKEKIKNTIRNAGFVMYKNEKLRYIKDFHGEAVLWATRPEQRSLDHMTFVGGDPDEYCIFIKDLSEEEKREISFLPRQW